MKRDVKTEIVLTATRMFDESGYRAVSMRSIADALGISVGNLTYHFKRKEDLFEAVMQERQRRCREMPLPSTVAELDYFFRALLAKRRQSILFAHCDRQECSRERIFELHQTVIAHMGELLHNALEALTAHGSLREDPARIDVEHALLGVLLFGLPGNLSDRESDHIEETCKCVWGVLSLLMTEQGREELHRLNENRT